MIFMQAGRRAAFAIHGSATSQGSTSAATRCARRCQWDSTPGQVLPAESNGCRCHAIYERANVRAQQEDPASRFSRMFLHNVIREHQQRFIRICAARVRPALEQ
jgi:hypothetical protein